MTEDLEIEVNKKDINSIYNNISHGRCTDNKLDFSKGGNCYTIKKDSEEGNGILITKIVSKNGNVIILKDCGCTGFNKGVYNQSRVSIGPVVFSFYELSEDERRIINEIYVQAIIYAKEYLEESKKATKGILEGMLTKKPAEE